MCMELVSGRFIEVEWGRCGMGFLPLGSMGLPSLFAHTENKNHAPTMLLPSDGAKFEVEAELR